MSETDMWARAVTQPLWRLIRIVRSTRQPLDQVSVDASLLRRCAQEHQALLVDRCDLEGATALVRRAGDRMESGLAWVIAATVLDYCALRDAAERSGANHIVHRDRREFGNPDAWPAVGIRLFLTSVAELTGASGSDRRQRAEIRKHFCPVLIVVDPELALCTRRWRSTWDPAWALRDAIARLCTEQQAVPVVILTRREHASINVSGVQQVFGVSGLLYFDGAASHSL